MFDIEKSISDWRRAMLSAGIESPATLDELENHLRETIDRLVRAGKPLAEAFDHAVLQIGSASAIGGEFAKTCAPSPRAAFNYRLCFAFAAAIFLINTWTVASMDLSPLERFIGFSLVVAAAIYVAVLPSAPRLLSPENYLRFLTLAKCGALYVLAFTAFALLTAMKVIHVNMPFVLSLGGWLLYAAGAITVVLTGNNRFDIWRNNGPQSPPWGPMPLVPKTPFGPRCPSGVPPMSGEALQALELARAEAIRLGHDYIGTEHLLLGAMRAGGQPFAAMAEGLGITGVVLQAEIERLVVAQPDHVPAAPQPLTPRARKALQLAAKASRHFRHRLTTAEHIFLGLLEEGSGVAALALRNLGCGLKEAREAVSKSLSTGKA